MREYTRLLLAIALGATSFCRPAESRAPMRAAHAESGLPRLVDLGAGKCIPCKAMAPILEDLKAAYAGRIDVQFIDVWKHPEQAAMYDVRMIPTQVFYGADGRERTRHEGFMSREQILAQWRALGVEL